MASAPYLRRTGEVDMRSAMMGLAVLMLAACGAKDEAAAAPDGRAAFRQCAVCHTAAAPDTAAGKMRLVGPPLWGVYGRPAASVPDFNYSRAMKASGLVWDEATLDRFLTDPRVAVPGTMMSFAGEKDATKRAAIIAYLKTLK